MARILEVDVEQRELEECACAYARIPSIHAAGESTSSLMSKAWPFERNLERVREVVQYEQTQFDLSEVDAMMGYEYMVLQGTP
jgi:hypothetical protein